ncbi:MAG: hypothetical protein DRO62_02990, partial [Candidatus Altiarchaeales archaeon]
RPLRPLRQFQKRPLQQHSQRRQRRQLQDLHILPQRVEAGAADHTVQTVQKPVMMESETAITVHVKVA